MDKLVIHGGVKLEGSISAGASKNCALPVMFASLLAPGLHRISRVPKLQDMESTRHLLSHLGCKISSPDATSWQIESSALNGVDAPYDLVRKMRASFLCLGPLIARGGHARVSLPGGCAIGARPIDLHLFALEKLGAIVEQSQGFVDAKLRPGQKRLRGAKIIFPMVSVGATENALLAASLAEGRTHIENAACEPEIGGLIEALTSMGAKIRGTGTASLEVEGQAQLKPMTYEIPPDRIESATYLIGAQLTGGDVTVNEVHPGELQGVIEKLEATGAKLSVGKHSVRCQASAEIRPVDIKTAPYPGFATDLQAQWTALMVHASGESSITEAIFENRFMHVPELVRMGAKLNVTGASVQVSGRPHLLQGAPVMATDLRASACLVLAGLAAQGTTSVKRIYHLDRGYEAMERKLQQLGARIERVRDT